MRKQILFTFCCLLLQVFVFAQSKALTKADRLYKAKSYTEAATFYETALEEKPSLSVKTKLANCYRVNNRMKRAEELYAEITSEKKAKSKTYFYYGEALMSNGKYDEAKKWFVRYEKEEQGDEQALLLIDACDYVKSIQPYFAEIKTENFAHNSDADDSTPVLWRDKLVFSSDRSQGLTQKSGWTGRSFINLFYSEKTDNGFTEPKVFSGKLSQSNKNTGNPSFVDSTRIFFTRNSVELSKRKIYNLSLFTARSTGNTRWENVEVLPFSSKEYNFMHPAASADGKYLYFVSDKGGGEGGTDIWVSKRTEKGWSRTKNLGVNVNTAANEGYPFIDRNGRLYFCSKGHPGYGGFDVFMTEQDENGEWKKPVNLGSPINSPRDDISIFIDAKMKKGMFTSNRSGGDDDIYLFEIIRGHDEKPTLPAVVPVMIEKEEEEIAIEKKTVEIVEEKVEKKSEAVIEEKKVEIEEEVEIVVEKKEKIEEKADLIVEEKVVEVEPVIEEKTLVTEEEEVLITEKSEDVTPTIVAETPVEIDVSETEKEKSKVQSFHYLSEISEFVQTDKLATGQVFRLENAPYAFEVYEVTPEIAEQLDIIADFLTKNETKIIEIGAHTESKGNDKNNLILSRYRAQAAVAYLKKQGISKERLSYKGYGESDILNQCINDVNGTEKEHLYNQRLEMKVIK